MARYVLIESRDPFESRDVPGYFELATQLAAAGNQVTLFLVQNGVLAVRSRVPSSPLAAVVDAKVEILADGFSLQERGIRSDERIEAVKTSDIDALVDLALDEPNTKIMWH